MNAGKIIKRLLFVLLLLLALGAFKAFEIYKKAFAPNVMIPAKDREAFFYVHSDYTYDSVLKELKEQKLLKNIKSFEWTATRKNYQAHINPGRYLLKHRMSNNDLVNKLRSGRQDPVELTFNNIRTLGQFAGRVGEQLEFDSSTLLSYMGDTALQHKYGLNSYTMACMFIPNTYELYWNITPEKFLDRMYSEYENFWNNSRTAKAEEMGKSREEIITLASIVNEETRKKSEKKRIAGVYINRLKKGMRLQADPTVIFGLGNMSIRRVLRKHYLINTPYNTYMHYGLPPGPICFPDISTIDAVLNYEKNDYLYFCAKPDFSGYHNFAKTLSEHNKNARAYQVQLNKKRIYK